MYKQRDSASAGGKENSLTEKLGDDMTKYAGMAKLMMNVAAEVGLDGPNVRYGIFESVMSQYMSDKGQKGGAKALNSFAMKDAKELMEMKGNYGFQKEGMQGTGLEKMMANGAMVDETAGPGSTYFALPGKGQMKMTGSNYEQTNSSRTMYE